MERIFGERYEVEAPLGTGGMAEVWKGHDRVLNRTVAIKTLLPQFARDASFVDRFRREAQAAARLNHPGIVSVYDSGTDGDTPYIVMQYIEGKTLADFLGSGKTLPPMQAATIGQEIAEALAAAHAQGVIHRDIKPANVMITREGKVRVMDFGIARLISGPETAPQTSAVLGTASYLSPEQAQGQSVDARSDIYALGVVLYEMLTGRPPFTGESPMAIAYKQVNATPEAPSSVNSEVPPELDAVVMRALSKNPANRYQTGQEFADDLERVRTGGQVMATPLLPAGGEATQVISRPQPTSVLPPQERDPGSPRKTWVAALLAILVMALLAAGAYLAVTMLTDDGAGEMVAVPDLERAHPARKRNSSSTRRASSWASRTPASLGRGAGRAGSIEQDPPADQPGRGGKCRQPRVLRRAEDHRGPVADGADRRGSPGVAGSGGARPRRADRAERRDGSGGPDHQSGPAGRRAGPGGNPGERRRFGRAIRGDRRRRHVPDLFGGEGPPRRARARGTAR